MDTQLWEPYFDGFREKTEKFYNGELSQGDYKSCSGLYGSYAQRGGRSNMLRLRMTAGRVTKEKMDFTACTIKKYQIKRIHFTTCQTIQLHDLEPEAAADIMREALGAGIVTIGSGGDYPRSVMCSPLSGVEKDEYFDVMPYAQAAGDYIMQFITAPKMPRKLKIGFSNSPKNITHATYRDLGFTATAEGKFDVYSAGGLGPNPCLGVLAAESIEPEMIMYYIKAMWLTFLSYGNYESRVKGRTRYMQEALGGPEAYKAAYQEKLQQVLQADEDLRISVSMQSADKQGDGTDIQDWRIIEQKQAGLYTVMWHPLGGIPDVEVFCALNEVIQGMEAVEMRLAPDETAYIINLTGREAEKILEMTADSAASIFETSVSCIGASTCQVGLRDAQALLAACIEAVRKAGLSYDALPQIHISGCPSSCGTHQTGVIGFRGGVKRVDGKPQPGYVMYVNGCERQGQEAMGHEAGIILEKEVPEFLVKLGRDVQESGMDFRNWQKKHPERIDMIAAEFTS